MIYIKDHELQLNLTEHLTILHLYGFRLISTSVGFDDTKVLEILGLSIATNAIIRGTYPNHFIDINGKSDEKVIEMQRDKSEIDHAKELKIAVVIFQDPVASLSPYFYSWGPATGNQGHDFLQ